MKVYLVRHGESTANIKHVYSGWDDVCLTKTGEDQAYKIADFFNHVTIDSIYSSDLNRAFTTASIINQRLNKKIIKTKFFREINFGLWEGLSFYQIKKDFPKEYLKWKNDYKVFKYPQGESYEVFYNRVIHEFNEVTSKSTGDNILIVAHSGVIQMILSYIATSSKKAFWSFQISNAKVSMIQRSDDFWYICGLNIGGEYDAK